MVHSNNVRPVVVAPRITEHTLKSLKPDYVYTITVKVRYDGENSYSPSTEHSINIATKGQLSKQEHREQRSIADALE